MLVGLPAVVRSFDLSGVAVVLHCFHHLKVKFFIARSS